MKGIDHSSLLWLVGSLSTLMMMFSMYFLFRAQSVTCIS